jgi:hypothetical protein
VSYRDYTSVYNEHEVLIVDEGILMFYSAGRGDESLRQDWLKYFKEAYIRRKEREEMIHRPMFMPGQQPYPQAIFGPPLPYAPGAPSGIIGGDYDIDPFGKLPIILAHWGPLMITCCCCHKVFSMFRPRVFLFIGLQEMVSKCYGRVVEEKKIMQKASRRSRKPINK